MLRDSAFAGTNKPNARPVTVLTPDFYVKIQGQSTVIGCGECKREINLNDYITSVSTDGSVDSPPGSATIQMTIPMNDPNSNLFQNNELILNAMMEIEIYSKGYYLINGVTPYYRIFWGLITTVTTSFSDGVQTITLSCSDILHWWELTTTIINPALIDSEVSVDWQLWGNQFAGMNPYAVIIKLAQSATGDLSQTTSSFLSFNTDTIGRGPTAEYLKDTMAYWATKFATIKSSLVLYGMSGTAYPYSAIAAGDVDPNKAAAALFVNENNIQDPELNATSTVRTNVSEMAGFKMELAKAGGVSFFETEAMDKLRIAQIARDQSGFEFFCDCNGDIVFKPPFYNLPVIRNKPVSWIFNHELIDDSIVENSKEVYTHVTASGNAFGGVIDWGLNDEITSPNTGVFDYHLLRQYGWRRNEMSVEWAGDPRKLFYHLLDYMDKLNSKRHTGNVQIPIRPELRMGFPIYIEKHDAYFYIDGISHNITIGGKATTTLTLRAKRSKFLPPKNIGLLSKNDSVTVTQNKYDANGNVISGDTLSVPVYDVSWTGPRNSTINRSGQEPDDNSTLVQRDSLGRLVGMPNVVMVYDKNANKSPDKIVEEAQNRAQKAAVSSGFERGQSIGVGSGDEAAIQAIVKGRMAPDNLKNNLIRNRYQAAINNMGAYDYAVDKSATIKEFKYIQLNSKKYNNQTVTFDPSAAIAEIDRQIKDIEGRLYGSNPTASDGSGSVTGSTTSP